MEILIGLLPWVVIFSIVFMLISRTKRKQKVKSTHIVRIRPVNCISPMRIVGGDDESFHQFNSVIKQSINKKNNDDYENFMYETTGLYCPFTNDDD